MNCLDQESVQFSDDESDNPTYLECGYTTDSSQDCDDSTNSNKTENLENSKDVYMVVVSDNNKTVNNARFHCELCNITYNSKTETSEHLLTHKSCKECEICNNIMDEDAYSIHMRLHKESYKQQKAKNKTQCQKCGKTVGKSYLKFHMLTHGSAKDKLGRMKQCPICNKSVYYYYYSDHVKRMHLKVQENTTTVEENNETCPVCDRSVKESKIKKHIASHSRSKKDEYVCEQCGKILKQSAFHTHRLTHTSSLPYKCEFCPYRGLHLGLLKVHVRTHTKDYAYECSVCQKKFITKSNLSQHERTHKPPEFSCSTCGKKFAQKRSLDKHIKVIHLNIRHVKCDVCSKAFGNKDALISHQKKVHNMRKWPHLNVGRTANYLIAELSAQNILAEK